MFGTYDRPVLFPANENFTKFIDELFEGTKSALSTDRYPATDIYVKEDKTYIDIAVTGFSKDDITIELDDGILTVKGNHTEKDEDREYHVRNIAQRKFERKFTLAKSIKDIKAKVKNGILSIELVEDKKDKKLITIE